MVERLTYGGVLGDRQDITRRRMRLSARMRGLGLRSRVELAPAAFCACFVESVEQMVDGAARDGFFRMLQPHFGPVGAFDHPYPASPRLAALVAGDRQGIRLPVVDAF